MMTIVKGYASEKQRQEYGRVAALKMLEHVKETIMSDDVIVASGEIETKTKDLTIDEDVWVNISSTKGFTFTLEVEEFSERIIT